MGQNLQLTGMLFKICGNSLGIGFHAFIALLPASRANLAVLFMELQGLDHAQRLIDIAAQGQGR